MLCKKCGKPFKTNVIVNGKRKHLQREYCLNCYPLGKIPRSKLELLSQQDLQKLLDTSSSYAEVLHKVGLSDNNNNYTTLNKYIAKYNLDLTAINVNRKKLTAYKTKLPTDQIELYYSLVRGEINRKPSLLLDIICNNNIRPYKCELCGISTWRNNTIRLELHHKDGNHKNNKLDNLQILCPNCHSQTNNFRSKNKRKQH